MNIYHANKQGFTLIELLVVVLIIGILASVALPQYQKAVRKARLSEVSTTYSSLTKAIDAWLLENDGYPTSSNYVYFMGTKGTNLDITQTCATEDDYGCYTKIGKWTAYCGSVGGQLGCEITLYTANNADKTTGNKWLEEKTLGWRKFKGDDRGAAQTDWFLVADRVGYMSASLRKEICLWWTGMYGSTGVLGAYGAASTTCN